MTRKHDDFDADPPIRGGSLLWPMVLAVIALVVALVFAVSILRG